MRIFLNALFIVAIPVVSLSQTPIALRSELKTARSDSARFVALKGLADHYVDYKVDSALLYLDQAIAIANKNHQWLDVALESDWKANQLESYRKFPESYHILKAVALLADDPANEKKTWIKNKYLTYKQYRFYVLANIYEDFGHLAKFEGDVNGQLQAYRKSSRLAQQSGDKTMQSYLDINLAGFYIAQKSPDSALIYTNAASILFKQTGEKKYGGMIDLYKGEIYAQLGDTVLSLRYFHAVESVSSGLDVLDLVDSYAEIAHCYLSLNKADSGLFYSKKFLTGIYNGKVPNKKNEAYELLYKSYLLEHKRDSAFKYLQLAYGALESDSKSYAKSLGDVQRLSFQDQIHVEQLKKEKAALQTRVRTYGLLAVIAVFMLLAGISYRNNRKKQKVNDLLSQRNEEISQQKEEIESQRDNLGQALEKLKNTQTQLIQSEKMASLGELTAGIAHEIQNPLNFVNNFSEVSVELLEELKEEAQHGNTQEVIAIAGDLTENLNKISHHGKRADGIVKGMLEHSRVGTGEKQTTDLNALADEFLKLSYHGQRAKDKSFNSEMVTHFDADLPKVTVIQQDIGRVLLNLFNNAFYAVNQRQKTAGLDYRPKISVTTSTENGLIVIKVKDNGNGIPDTIKDKIMQPFFTTKPTGEGTGLGLSLTYDMVVKGHGGSIQLNSKEGEGSEFIVSLPIS